MSKYDAKYDVIIVGFGGAGATAARFVADKGAQTLVVDVAPLGHEGGNTRYCGQDAGVSDDYDETLSYYKQITAPFHEDQKVIKAYVRGLANMKDYYRKYFGVEPHITQDKPQFPEFKGAHSYYQQEVHNGGFDAALWKLLRSKVAQRKEKIDVWLESPAKHLIMNHDTNVIEGVQIQRHGKLINVFARQGVILSLGGFENNPMMKETFLGRVDQKPLGSLYNRGDGIKLVSEVGAKLWHMWNFETLGVLHGLAIADEDKRAHLIFGWPQIGQGSTFVVAPDGERYFREDENNRHGHIYYHGSWEIPPFIHGNPFLIMDEHQIQDLQSSKNKIINFDQKVIKANTIAGLASKIGVSVDNLAETTRNFNHFAETGKDIQFKRDPKSMRELKPPYYALKLEYDILNTQGGAARNEKGQILNYDDQPIAHLYGAGEFGSFHANLYQGGGNIAECLISGKIAADNVVKEEKLNSTSISTQFNGINDIISADELNNVKLNRNQYIGSSDAGIGGKLVVKVTYKDKTIKNISVLQNHESEDVGLRALKILPKEMIDKNTTDVDVVSGASRTSRALKDAVRAAIKKAK